MPELGMVAAVAVGVELSRLALIPDPQDQLVAVDAALIDRLDLVALAAPIGSLPANASVWAPERANTTRSSWRSKSGPAPT